MVQRDHGGHQALGAGLFHRGGRVLHATGALASVCSQRLGRHPSGRRGGFFAFIGFDAVSTAAEECRNPRRDLPIGILGSLAACTLIYVAVAVVLTGMIPWNKLNTAEPLSVAMRVVHQEGAGSGHPRLPVADVWPADDGLGEVCGLAGGRPQFLRPIRLAPKPAEWLLKRHLDPSPPQRLGQLHALRQRHHVVLVAVHNEEGRGVLRHVVERAGLNGLLRRSVDRPGDIALLP